MSFASAATNSRPDRVFVARHPRCPNVRFGDSQVGELRDANYRVEVMDTEPTYEATEEKFHKLWRPGDVNLVIGGEGTTNRMYRIIRGLSLMNRNITAIGGGNACDYRNMVNPGKRALEVLKMGHYIAMQALTMEVEGFESGDTASYDALAYLGVGGTAKASHNIDWSKRFSNQFTRRAGIQRGLEAVVAWTGVGMHPDFTVTMDDESIAPFSASDFSAFNGDRVAVYGKPHGDIFDTESYTAMFSRPWGMPGALIDMVAMQQGKSQDEPQKKPLGFTIRMDEEHRPSPLFVHVDGEASRIPGHSHLMVGLDSEPYFTYSTRAAELAVAA